MATKKTTKKKGTAAKKKVEFSKLMTGIIVVVLLITALCSIAAYYYLTYLAINKGASVIPDVNLPVTCITCIIGAILSYCLYQFGLKSSRNRYQIDENGEPIKKEINAKEIGE